MPIAFFFSAMSPYSWLAAERIGELIPAADWRPVFGARVQQANGRISWGLTERRDAETAECEARARRYGLGQMRWPDPWPSNGALVARALVHLRSQGDLKRFALMAMRMEFLEGLDLGEVESLRAVASRVGFSAEDVAAAVNDPNVDARMRKVCDEAIARGVFGIPTVLVDNELFWGDDRLEEASCTGCECINAGLDRAARPLPGLRSRSRCERIGDDWMLRSAGRRGGCERRPSR